MESKNDTEHSDVTKPADSTELYFGDTRFSEQSIEEVRFSNRREGNLGIRDASLGVVPSEELRWDYRAEAKLYGKGSLRWTRLSGQNRGVV